MKKLGFLVLLATCLSIFSCSKDNDNIYKGEWASEQDNPTPIGNNLIYYGQTNDTVTASRIITDNDVKLYENKFVNFELRDKKIYYGEYFLESNSPSCSSERFEFYNVVGELKGDTLIETGNYRFYINGNLITDDSGYSNKYIGKFVKRKNG